MILEIMIFVLGAVAASLIALLVTPVVARRAARTAAARLEASLPVSRSEINAEKDRLRARFAAANRRLELAISRLNEKLAARMVEANRQREEIARLVSREGELAGAHGNLERRVAELTTTLERAEHRLSAATAEMVLREERLNQRSAELAHLKANISIRDLLTEEQRVELVARDTAIANLQDALSELHSTVANTAAARDQLSTNLVAQGESVAAREQRILTLEASTTVLQTERAERIAELGRRADEIATLRAELAEARIGRDEVPALTATVASLRAENLELRRAMAVAAAEAERATEMPSQVVPISEALAARIATGNGAASNGKAAVNGNGAAASNGHANGKAAINGNGANGHQPDATPRPATLPAPVSLRARLRALQRATGTRH